MHPLSNRLQSFLAIALALTASFSNPLWACDGDKEKKDDSQKQHLPYDASRNPNQDIAQAVQSLGDRKLIVLTFGANWCKDCRVLDKELCKDPLKSSVLSRAELVKVDIGNWDHNQAVVNRFGNPTAKGIPAVVIIDRDQNILAAAKGGELAKARHMSRKDMQGYLDKLIKEATTKAKVKDPALTAKKG